MSETEALDQNVSPPGSWDRWKTSNPRLAEEERAAGPTAVKDPLEELMNKRLSGAAGVGGAEVTWRRPGLPEL